MSNSALAEIEKHELAIKQLRSQAGAEIAQEIAAVKQKLRELQLRYEEVTGKPATAEPIAGKRTRASSEEVEALAATISATLKGSKEGLSISKIAEKIGQPVPRVRFALKKVKGLTKKGSLASTVYSVK